MALPQTERLVVAKLERALTERGWECTVEIGHRKHWRRAGDDYRITVKPRTVWIYEAHGDRHKSFRTADLLAILRCLDQLDPPSL